MREKVYKNIIKLKENNKNTIVFYKNNQKIVKTFSDFARDIEDAIARLNHLNQNASIKTIAICGPVSYQWAVLDFACIKGGYQSVAIPETFSSDQISQILQNLSVDIFLCDYLLKSKLNNTFKNLYYFNSERTDVKQNFYNYPAISAENEENIILKNYGIGFSSGTSDKLKKIILTFNKENNNINTSFIRKIQTFYKYRKSFWAKKDNKIIIFMPFSHLQQRGFFRLALFNNIDIVLSDPLNCLKHIILEKPNIMISVPLVYEAIANRIKVKLERFNSTERFLFNMFNTLYINRLSNNNFIKQAISKQLFSKIKTIYGGRADYFVTGSAPISPKVIKIFYSIGIKIFEGYGQSEIGNIAMNSPANFRIGSVGKPLKEIKISEDSEILVKFNANTNEANKDILNVDPQGFIHTGDLGFIDKDGFVFITGRKDDVIVLENGKKIFPEKIENEFKNFEVIRDAFIFSANGHKINVVLDCYSLHDISNFRRIINEINDKLMTHEKIEKFHVTVKLFSAENGMLTGTFKKKRNKIKEYCMDKEFINVN
jgi:long-chain acyl-CoA synthetase